MWFTTKVRYEKTRENGSLKTITEPYLVDALSFTEAEARITNEMMPYTSGAFSVSAVKRSNISEIFWDEDGDHFYKAKINLITLDENTGAERKKSDLYPRAGIRPESGRQEPRRGHERHGIGLRGCLHRQDPDCRCL